MVASLSALKSTAQAAGYYSQIDDYYRDNALSPTQWSGSGAHVLGLRGAVDSDLFTSLLEGYLPNGQQLGRPRVDGEIQHRPGWDLTFSAPKSVSALALVGQDERLIQAHEKAVGTALRHLEAQGAAHQVHAQSPLATKNLLVAQFRHATSREQQPQLHSHCVILNCTQDADGRWRSLESRPLYRLQKEAGLIYRSELARQCRALGYVLEATQIGKEPGFELVGVPQALLNHWSERSRQIEAALHNQGQTRETASAAAKEAATLRTRERKQEIDHVLLRSHWQKNAKSFDVSLEQCVAASRINEMHASAAMPLLESNTAHEVIMIGVEKLAERNSRFSMRELLAEARIVGFGKVPDASLRDAMDTMEADGRLIARQVNAYDPVTGAKQNLPGYTTATAIAMERALLATAQHMLGGSQALCSDSQAIDAIHAQEMRSGHVFNRSQRSTTLGILTSQNHLHLVQGYAGTAKTTSVLAATAAELARQGQTVIALAPTVAAAQTLSVAIGHEGITVASHLARLERAAVPGGRQTWIVDEASLLSTKDMARLLKDADKLGARVILVGDCKQLGSVEAGAAFRQLQDKLPLQTHVLDEIVRQRNEPALQAVHASIAGDARAALQAIDNAGVVFTDPDRQGRIQALVKDYMAQPTALRQNSLVVALGRDDRQEINTAIRTAMIECGELSGASLSVDILVSKDLTRVERSRVESYQSGDVVRFARDYQRLGVAKGGYAMIEAVDLEKHQLTVRTEAGDTVTYNPRLITKIEAFEQEARSIRIGEQIRLSRNDRALGHTNGESLMVERIEGQQLLVRNHAGQTRWQDMAKMQYRHLDHAYCSTAYAAQGQTADRVFVHVESFRTNLASQQSLYVAISRAREQIHLYTDHRENLIRQVARESGEKSMAIESASPPHFPQKLEQDHAASVPTRTRQKEWKSHSLS